MGSLVLRQPRMIEFAFVMLLLTTGGAVYALYVAYQLPLGYEDQRGFHFAEPEPERTPRIPF